MVRFLFELDELQTLVNRVTRKVVAEMIKADYPVKDLLSQNEAFERFGRRWVQDKIDRRLVVGVRMGDTKNSKLRYSRADLMGLLVAEAEDRAQLRYVADVRRDVDRLSTGTPVISRSRDGEGLAL